MANFHPSQLVKMVLFLFLLLIIPFVSASMRTSYLYFLLNILIVVLGIEAGFLTAISGTDGRKGISQSDGSRSDNSVRDGSRADNPNLPEAVCTQQTPEMGAMGAELTIQTTAPIQKPSVSDGSRADNSNLLETVCAQPVPATLSEPTRLVEKKVAPVMKRTITKVKRCPSLPSLFFIGSYEVDEEHKEKMVVEEDGEYTEEVVAVGEATAQELFAKAEAFIGNFYKQLQMQREDSWKKIHGLYHRAF